MIGHPIFYRKAVPIENNTHKKYYKQLDKVLRVYHNDGYSVKTLHCDGKYKSMMDPVSDGMNVMMAYSNPGDHVPQVEQNNCRAKDTVHTTLRNTGYTNIPKQIISELVELCVNGLNMFPVDGCILSYYSP